VAAGGIAGGELRAGKEHPRGWETASSQSSSTWCSASVHFARLTCKFIWLSQSQVGEEQGLPEGGFLFPRLPELPWPTVSRCWGRQQPGAPVMGRAERQPGTREGRGAAFLVAAGESGPEQRDGDAGCARLTPAAHLRLSQSQAASAAAGTVTLVVACFPLGTRALLLRLYRAVLLIHSSWGRGIVTGTVWNSPRAAAHPPSALQAGSLTRGQSFLLLWGFCVLFCFFSFRALLAVGCLLPWLQGEPRGTLLMSSSEEGQALSCGWLVPITGGSFAEGSHEFLCLESVWACRSGGGKQGACLLRSAAALVLLPAWDVLPRNPSRCGQPRWPGSETQRHPQLPRRATCFAANKI